MRRFVAYYRRGSRPWRRLQQGQNARLLELPEIHQAICYLRENPSTEGIAVRVGVGLFNIMVAAPTDPLGFTFPFPAS